MHYLGLNCTGEISLKHPVKINNGPIFLWMLVELSSLSYWYDNTNGIIEISKNRKKNHFIVLLHYAYKPVILNWCPRNPKVL